MKKIIRLTEGDLHRIVKESSNRIINEIGDTYDGYRMLGRLRNKKAYIDLDDDATERVRDYRHNILKNHPEFAKKDKELDDYYKRAEGNASKQLQKQAIAKLKEESNIHKIVKESVRRTLKEYYQPYDMEFWDEESFMMHPEDSDRKKPSDSDNSEINNKFKDDTPPRKKWFKRFRR